MFLRSLSLDSLNILLRLSAFASRDDVRDVVDDALSDDACDAIIDAMVYELMVDASSGGGDMELIETITSTNENSITWTPDSPESHLFIRGVLTPSDQMSATDNFVASINASTDHDYNVKGTDLSMTWDRFTNRDLFLVHTNSGYLQNETMESLHFRLYIDSVGRLRWTSTAISNMYGTFYISEYVSQGSVGAVGDAVSMIQFWIGQQNNWSNLYMQIWRTS